MAGGKYASFEDYCKKRWGWNRSYAYEIAKSGKIMKQIEKSGIPDKPTSASQARPLGKLPESEQPEAWAEAVESAD